ncbi:O-methyltransferase [Nitrosopumilus adriaticus]|uniref:O-methyltransferase family protein n=1 Tax=Nitrosopumilus adriaticus TaxID=1580092 RepID=A0A0D5C3N1_9ARCH|nr:O-methyltransferase [Nitrosopumilus adriaticus]AJW71012.1 O-methyltransferase family protein [Nitrosopumilus adriaticus]
MNESILKVLEKLEEQSSLEKSRKVNVLPEDRMLAITKETGELLNMILRLKNAKNMLEIGMSVGYSTIWCAEAIKEHSGKIISIEHTPSKIKRAKENFLKAGIEDIIIIKEGEAMNILKEFSKKENYRNFFDFVLIDADKENIIEYFDTVLPMVSLQGVIITDNMLYPEKYREDMKKYSNYLKTNPNIITITSEIGNGEEITIKIK